MRLDNALRKAGFGGRNQIKKLLRSKQVTVDGVWVQKEGLIVDSYLQDIRVSGKKVQLEPEVYYLLNKPSGVVTACLDRQHQTVLDLLKPCDQAEGLYPIGRLDRDTEGLVLLTNNGPLGFRMLHPSHHVEKTYYLEVNGLLGEDAVSFFQSGITFLDGVRCKPAQLEILSAEKRQSSACLTISEGKFHQVKKMFLAYGVKVTYLKRIAFGGLLLDSSLKTGAYRALTAKELEVIKTYFD